MALTFIKTSCAFILVLLMVLNGTKGAKIPRTTEHPKHKSTPHPKNMVQLQLDSSALSSMPPVRAMHNFSISPWAYNKTHDASLYPSFVSEAYCLLKGCLDSEGREDMSLESKPILHEVLFLRRVRSLGSQNYTYKLEPRMLAVGCTCVQPVVLRQQ